MTEKLGDKEVMTVEVTIKSSDSNLPAVVVKKLVYPLEDFPLLTPSFGMQLRATIDNFIRKIKGETKLKGR